MVLVLSNIISGFKLNPLVLSNVQVCKKDTVPENDGKGGKNKLEPLSSYYNIPFSDKNKGPRPR